MSIAILIPSRGRAAQLKRMMESACATSNQNIIFYLAISQEDLEKDYAQFAKPNNYICVVPDNMPTAHKWNLLAEYALQNSTNKLFMLGSDDIVFATPHWDETLLNHYNNLEHKVHVYHLRDSRNENGTPHPIVTREYINYMGYMIPPLFLHWFVDTWTVVMAKNAWCFTHFKEYELIHDKPSDKGRGDETFNRIRNFGWHERDAWVNNKFSHILGTEALRLRNAFRTYDGTPDWEYSNELQKWVKPQGRAA